MHIQVLTLIHWLRIISYPFDNLKEEPRNCQGLAPSNFYALRGSIHFSINHFGTSVLLKSPLSSDIMMNLILATILSNFQVLTRRNTLNQKPLPQRTEGPLAYRPKKVAFLQI